VKCTDTKGTPYQKTMYDIARYGRVLFVINLSILLNLVAE